MLYMPFLLDSHNMTPSPPLAALVRQVRLSADAAQRTSDEQKNYQRRLKTLSHLSVEDCQEVSLRFHLMFVRRSV